MFAKSPGSTIFDDLPPPPCHDGPVQLPQCTRDPDTTCRRHYTDCPPSCVALATRETPVGASCDDAVCRDTTTAVCAWW